MTVRTLVQRAFGALALPALMASPVAAAQRPAADVARDHVRTHKQELGLTASDVADLVVSSEVSSAHNGVTHVYLQQRYRGIDVHAAILNVNVASDGRVLDAGNRFVPQVAAKARGSARKAAMEAVAAAAGHLGLKARKELRMLGRRGGQDEAVTLTDGGLSARPIEARLVWLPVEEGLRLAWSVEIEEAEGDHWWNAFVDAETGELLAKEDRIVHDSAADIAAAIAHTAPEPLTLPLFPDIDGSAYRVFALPLESPSDGDRTLVTGAADPVSSPHGWHDFDGAPGAEFITTQGNNVHAYADRDANNVADPGSSPSDPNLFFDFPLDFSRRPADSQPAMVTNLFYWNNIMHDVTYRYGFDEAVNFQQVNRGPAGLGADYVRAEAQDGSGRNNANFGTGVDGVRPRMQMFEWRSAAPNPVTVAAPSPIAGTYFGPMAGFGESLVTTGPLSGTAVVVNDGVGVTTDGCEPFALPPGSVPIIDRGACNFTVKVKNAQVAGAAVAIVANNIPGPPFGMGGADPTIIIPSVMVSLDDGTLFKAHTPFTVTIADGTGGVPDRDSDLDAGVIAHEYGHGISNRLTGGPAIVSCLNNAEQMGEGWSDWFALNMTSHPSDTRLTPRGVGSYVVFEPPGGPGIRPTPYSTDTAVNPSTYASVADVVNISQPHGIGYVWNTMLWEMHWNLVDRHGYNANIYEPWSTGGNNLALQLVMDGMKMQPCTPGFVDGRNAILGADMALTGGANRCEIWRAFAKRGLGASASQGLSTSRTDGVAAFDLPAACTAAVFGGFHPPVADAPAVNARNAGSTVPVKFTLSGEASPAMDSQPIDCDTLLPTGVAPAPIAVRKTKAKGDEHHLNWATDRSWEGTCRRLTVRIPAAADAVAYFRFH